MYLDDIVVHSKSIKEHLVHLEAMFEKLARHGLRMKLKKCQFLQTRIKLLGHVADKDGGERWPRQDRHHKERTESH